MTWSSRARKTAIDAVIASAYALILFAYSSVRVDGRLVTSLSGWGYLLPVAYIVLVFLRRRAPAAMLVAAVLLDLLAVGTKQMSDATAIAVILGTLVFERGRRAGWIGGAFVATVTIISALWLGRTPTGAFFTLTFSALGLIGGLAARTIVVRTIYTRRLNVENMRLRNEHLHAQVRAAITDEVHDVLTHTLTVTARLADAVTLNVRDAQRSRALAVEIAEASRRGLHDVRVTVGQLDKSSTPIGQSDISELVRSARLAGVPIVDNVRGKPADPITGRLILRTVQEALTNVMKHTKPTRVTIDVLYPTSAWPGEVRVHNDGVYEPRKSTGHGTPGLRRRWEAVGGSYNSGPDLAGTGWMVEARLPPTKSLSIDLGEARHNL